MNKDEALEEIRSLDRLGYEDYTRVRNAIFRYLQGQENWNWVIGEMKTVSDQMLDVILSAHKQDFSGKSTSRYKGLCRYFHLE